MTPPRVLVVDDEESLRLTLAANLELEGFEVIEAQDARSALSVLSGQTVDLVLSDVRMPGMDGVDLYREIRRSHPLLPVVLMTGFAVEDRIQGAVAQGVFAVLTKPFPVERVAPRLTRVARGPVVLVVDVAPEARDHLLGLLGQVGLRACAVATSEEAANTVKAGGIDVCVVDLALDDATGPALIAELHARVPDLACIAIAGLGKVGLVESALKGGAFGFVERPIDGPTLLALIAKARARRLLT